MKKKTSMRDELQKMRYKHAMQEHYINTLRQMRDDNATQSLVAQKMLAAVVETVPEGIVIDKDELATIDPRCLMVSIDKETGNLLFKYFKDNEMPSEKN